MIAVSVAPAASAHAPSGAIFTTLADGSEVNLNHFPTKDDVYLDGGPGPGAPQTAAGLDDGTYVFQVTDPSGANLLSQDEARCRQFTVSNGVIDGVVATGCEHVTGVDVDHSATTVQMMPYADTPNNGGVYKVWVTRVGDFIAGCAEFGVPNGLDVVDCGQRGGNRHGFVPAHSKTDNFKVKHTRLIREIDAIFYRDANGNGMYDWYQEVQLSGLHMKWIDTQGVQNTKHSYYIPHFNITAAHAEAVELGVHQIVIPDLSTLGCDVGEIYVNDINHYTGVAGPQTITVDLSDVKKSDKDATVQIWVACT